MGNKLIVYGAGSNGGKFAYDYREEGKYKQYEFVGFVDDEKKGNVAHFPILGAREDLPRLKAEGIDNIIVFLLKDAWERLSMCEKIAALGFNFPSFHPYLPSSVKLGAGVLMHEQATVLGHDITIRDHTVIGPHVTIEGGSIIGRGVILCPYSFVGYLAGVGDAATIYPRGSVAPGKLIGAGSIVGPHVWQNRGLPPRTTGLRRPIQAFP